MQIEIRLHSGQRAQIVHVRDDQGSETGNQERRDQQYRQAGPIQPAHHGESGGRVGHGEDSWVARLDGRGVGRVSNRPDALQRLS